MLGVVGSIAMDSRVALVTVSVVVPEISPEVAVIVVMPEVIAVAKPEEPLALLMVATPALEVPQTTEAVISCVVLSE